MGIKKEIYQDVRFFHRALQFCYLGYMLSVYGDADAAMTAKFHGGRIKFRSLTSFLTAKGVSLLLRENIDACVRSCMLQGSGMWSLKRENELALH